MDYKDHYAGASAHHFLFKGKQDLLAALLAQAQLFPAAKILDVGGGAGSDLATINGFGHVVERWCNSLFYGTLKCETCTIKNEIRLP